MKNRILLYHPMKWFSYFLMFAVICSCNNIEQNNQQETRSEKTEQKSTQTQGTFSEEKSENVSSNPRMENSTGNEKSTLEVEPEQDQSSSQALPNVPQVQSNTTQGMLIAGKAIVFYFPTNEEILNTEETEANAGIVEVLSDFENYARDFQKNHGLKDVQVLWSTQKYNTVHLKDGSTYRFERNLTDHVVGAIFTDGIQKPVEERSILTTEEYKALAKKFFKQ